MRVELSSRLNYTSFKAKKNLKSKNGNNIDNKQIRQEQDKADQPKKIIYQEPKIRVIRFEPMYIIAGSDGGGSGSLDDYDGGRGDLKAKSNMLNTIPDIHWENDL